VAGPRPRAACPGRAQAVGAVPAVAAPGQRRVHQDSPCPGEVDSRVVSPGRANALAASQAVASQRADLGLAGSRGRVASLGRHLLAAGDGRGVAAVAVAVAVAALLPAARKRALPNRSPYFQVIIFCCLLVQAGFQGRARVEWACEPIFFSLAPGWGRWGGEQ